MASLIASASSVVVRSVASALPPELYFRQLTVGIDFARDRHSDIHAMARQMNNYVYVLGDKLTREAVVVDAAWDPDGIAELVTKDNMTVISFVATHYHWDHIGGKAQGTVIPGIKEWAARGIPVHISSLELDAAAAQTNTDTSRLSPLEDGQCLAVGRFGIELIHTPGHSPGSMCLRVTDQQRENSVTATSSPEAAAGISLSVGNSEAVDLLLITGDTVFPGSCGRLDLPGSDARVMYDSLRRLAALPESLPIYPGHSYGGSSSTIGAEKANGLLREMTRAQWDRMMVRK